MQRLSVFLTVLIALLFAAPVRADILIRELTPSGVASVFAKSTNGVAEPEFLAFATDGGVSSVESSDES